MMIQSEILRIITNGEFKCLDNVPVMYDGGPSDSVWEATSIRRDGNSLTVTVKKRWGIFDHYPLYMFTRISQLQILDSLKSA